MRLTPLYSTDPVLNLDGDPSAIAVPAIRQRRRLAKILATLSKDQWHHPSRCSEWSNKDVIVHLNGTHSFWRFSIAAGTKGDPTQFLTAFDPARTPSDLVVSAGDPGHEEVLNEYIATTEAFAQQLSALRPTDWTALAEAPPGHISISAVVHHALWDSWVHERDILLPLGILPDEQSDELSAGLRYAAALGPALAITRGSTATGRFSVLTTDPELSFTVEIGKTVTVRTEAGSKMNDLQLTGSALDLLESLSVRRPFDQTIPPSAAWMLCGLSETFDNPAL